MRGFYVTHVNHDGTMATKDQVLECGVRDFAIVVVFGRL